MTFGIIEWVRNRRVVELFGLKRLSLSLVVIYTIFGGVASLVICGWAMGGLSQELMERVFTDLAAQESVETLRESKSVPFLILSIVMACIAAPLVEELLFRGYMYGAVKEATNPIFSAVVIGALFSVVHGNLPALIPLWAFSILLCLAYEWTRCLWVPIGMHAFFNAANIVLMTVPQTAE
ncbi:MAG: CPBP family intramembrane glutamic endopeptidase [Verrucomicrobiota bacterium]